MTGAKRKVGKIIFFPRQNEKYQYIYSYMNKRMFKTLACENLCGISSPEMVLHNGRLSEKYPQLPTDFFCGVEHRESNESPKQFVGKLGMRQA